MNYVNQLNQDIDQDPAEPYRLQPLAGDVASVVSSDKDRDDNDYQDGAYLCSDAN
jgi:hypothetical protein